MISVISVFNDGEVLEKRLLQSLRAQTAAHEVIALDNRDGRFASASEALNEGAHRANGEWLLFAHQDIALRSDDWLTRAEELLTRCAPRGWCGVAGSAEDGERRGFLLDRDALLGESFDDLVEVQTLDECLLVHRRDVNRTAYFDEQLTGWHAYGVEACCASRRTGHKNYVFALPTWHDSPSSNLAGLAEAHDYVWRKHGAALHHIATTCAMLPTDRTNMRARFGGVSGKVSRRLRRLAAESCGFRVAQVSYYGEALDELIAGATSIEVLHRRAPHAPITAHTFAAESTRKRRIVHHFGGLDSGSALAPHVMIAPDLSSELTTADEIIRALPVDTREAFVCLRLRDAAMRSRLFASLMRRARTRTLILHHDGTPPVLAVFTLDLRLARASD